ncbi:MAG: BrnT family toxin [Pseudomonadota bacterium]
MDHIVIPMDFEWDYNKEILNISKHNVSFSQAKQAFRDDLRIIADNHIKGKSEKRYYCYGAVNGNIMTVRFTLQNNRVRIIGAAYWRKGRKIYESRKQH